ncbi:carboxylesterase/lipase family protein [Actinocrispum wychmicini]|uniref:Carboxylic ester hydrolase n=1 Tax=Actinocrispum wychmicini TaxID=1213861 RepID=A0A4R2IQZ9_9PSEU|nr:carboxylesterase family protein [Actinocrispum wychmicini]TCO47387.1 para-nitrobenzyl esterase [Actinocrispum wychmicini]
MDTTVTEGQLSGFRQGTVTAFLGVPYAAPPERFRPAQPPEPWSGVRDATQVGPAAPQPRSRLAHVMGDRTLDQSEDCLTLNVWTPGGASKPVLVFLHGGGFTSGSGGLDWYNGAELASRGDIVVVTVNYRLGVLGFLRLDEGNLGVRDQIQALRWVRDNIAAFGGDPAAVTVAGQSAGAISIVTMLSGTRGLFHQAILQSTPGIWPQTAEEADARVGELVNVLGVQRDRLRDLPVPELLDAQQEVSRRNAPKLGPTPAFQLVAEGTVADDPIAAAGACGVPVLIGTTRDEASAFHLDATVTESLFREPAARLAKLLARHGNPAWTYQFDWSPPGSPFGACHCIELPFVLGNLDAWRDAPMLANASPTTLRALVDIVQPRWIAFVRTGDPGWSHQEPVHLSTKD